MSRILRETLQDHRGQRPRNLRPHLSRRDRRFGRDARDERHQVAIVKWRSTCQQVVQRCPNRVDVRAHIQRLATQLFRRCELWRRLNGSRRRELRDIARDVGIDKPKSPTLTVPSASTKQFDGLMSRWRIPAA